MRDRPLCFGCHRQVDYDPVFEAVCGHDGCPSAVWHGICLMGWREKRASGAPEWVAFLVRLQRDHRDGSG